MFLTEDLVLKSFFFCFGAIIGSFLNVCIVRMPHEKSIVWPGSHCVHCQALIPWYDNIPLLSCLILRGQCRFCHKRISSRYFLVEFLTGSFFVFFYHYYHLNWVLLPYLVLLCGLIVATFIDIEHRIIPDEISLGGIVVGLIFSVMIPGMHDFSLTSLWSGRIFMRILYGALAFAALIEYLIDNKKKSEDQFEDLVIMIMVGIAIGIELLLSFFLPSLQTRTPEIAAHLLSLDASLIGFLSGGGLIYAMGLLGNWLFKKESMGGGDVKLLAMIGSFLGWQMALLTFFVAPFFGAVVGVIVKLRTKSSVIAYGPFLALASMICLFWGKSIMDWLLFNSLWGY